MFIFIPKKQSDKACPESYKKPYILYYLLYGFQAISLKDQVLGINRQVQTIVNLKMYPLF